MANVRPKDLIAGTPTNTAALIFDSGAVVRKCTPTGVVDAAIPLASQAEAEAGTDNVKRVTPLRVAQAVESQALDPLASTSGASLIGNLGGGTVQDAIFTKGPLSPVAGSVAQIAYERMNGDDPAGLGGYWTQNIYWDHVVSRTFTEAQTPVGVPDQSQSATFVPVAYNDGSETQVVAITPFAVAKVSGTKTFAGNPIVTADNGLDNLKVCIYEFDAIVPPDCEVVEGNGIIINAFNIRYPGAAILIGNGGFAGGYFDVGVLIQEGVGQTAFAVSAFELDVGLDLSQPTFSRTAILLGYGPERGIEFGALGSGTSPQIYGETGGLLTVHLGANNLFAIKKNDLSANLMVVDNGGNLELAGTVNIPSSFSSSSATAGAATALPATPSGYITVKIGGTNRKIPYYA